MKKLFVILFVLGCFLTGCAQDAKRLVIENDPVLIENVEKALEMLNEDLGEEVVFFTTVEYGGNAKDWNRRFPRRGTVTMSIKNLDSDNERQNERAEYDSPIKTVNPRRGRIYFETNTPTPAAVIHEILHSKSYTHRDEEGFMSGNGASWKIDDPWFQEIINEFIVSDI